jgi:hypothetical protein
MINKKENMIEIYLVMTTTIILTTMMMMAMMMMAMMMMMMMMMVVVMMRITMTEQDHCQPIIYNGDTTTMTRTIRTMIVTDNDCNSEDKPVS